MSLGSEVGLGTGHIVIDGDRALPLPKGHSPQFSVHVCCGQTTGWIKISLNTQVGLDPGNIVLDGYPGLHGKGTAATNFRPMTVVAKRSLISATGNC